MCRQSSAAAAATSAPQLPSEDDVNDSLPDGLPEVQTEPSLSATAMAPDSGVPTLVVMSESGTDLVKADPLSSGKALSDTSPNKENEHTGGSSFASFAKKFFHHSRTPSKDASQDSILSTPHDDRASYTSGMDAGSLSHVDEMLLLYESRFFPSNLMDTGHHDTQSVHRTTGSHTNE
jgi:hypothetical protein